jgi:hypothetical protein
MRNENSTTFCLATQQQDAPSWIVSDIEEALAIELAPSANAHSLIQDEEDEELFVESQAHDQEPIDEDCWPPNLTDRVGPIWSRSNAGPDDIPKRLRESVPESAAPTWTISAPEIERATMALLVRRKRTPTATEIAKELNLGLIHYYEALILLRDIETEIVTPKADRRGNGLIWVGEGDDHAVFCCLRSEILTLFKTAVRTLPEYERLAITLRYCEDLNERQIRLTLEVPESSDTGLKASTSLHLRARLFGSRECDHYGDEVIPVGCKSRSRKREIAPEAHVYIHGGQDGWLPVGRSWESYGPNAIYNHVAHKYFFVDESGELMLVRREECRKLDLSEVWMRDPDKTCGSRCHRPNEIANA